MIVNAYVTQFDDLPGGDRLAMTVLDLRHAEKCGQRLESLATAIHNEISNELQHRHHGGAAGHLHGRRGWRREAADRPHDVVRNPGRQGNRQDGRADPNGRQSICSPG